MIFAGSHTKALNRILFSSSGDCLPPFLTRRWNLMLFCRAEEVSLNWNSVRRQNVRTTANLSPKLLLALSARQRPFPAVRLTKALPRRARQFSKITLLSVFAEHWNEDSLARWQPASSGVNNLILSGLFFCFFFIHALAPSGPLGPGSPSKPGSPWRTKGEWKTDCYEIKLKKTHLWHFWCCFFNSYRAESQSLWKVKGRQMFT